MIADANTVLSAPAETPAASSAAVMSGFVAPEPSDGDVAMDTTPLQPADGAGEDDADRISDEPADG